MSVEKPNRGFRVLLKGLGTLLVLCLILMGCDSSTSPNDEDPEEDLEIYRVLLENAGDGDVSYTGTVTFFYLEDSETINPPSGTIFSDNEVPVIFEESNTGAVGITLELSVTSETGLLQIAVERGVINEDGDFDGTNLLEGTPPIGPGDNFEFSSGEVE